MPQQHKKIDIFLFSMVVLHRDSYIPRKLEAAQIGSAHLQTLWGASNVQSDEGHVECCTDLRTHAGIQSTNGA